MSGALEEKGNEEIAIGRDALRWWDPLFVLVFALVGWFIVVGGPTLVLGGSLRDFDPRIATPSGYATNAQRFYAFNFYADTFYLAVLIVMCVLARRPEFRLFTDYFASIPFRSTLGAALFGAGIGGTFCLVFFGSRTVATVPMLHYRLGWLVASGPDVDRVEHRLYRRRPLYLAAERDAASRRRAEPDGLSGREGPGRRHPAALPPSRSIPGGRRGSRHAR